MGIDGLGDKVVEEGVAEVFEALVGGGAGDRGARGMGDSFEEECFVRECVGENSFKSGLGLGS